MTVAIHLPIMVHYVAKFEGYLYNTTFRRLVWELRVNLKGYIYFVSIYVELFSYISNLSPLVTYNSSRHGSYYHIAYICV